jgi:hypothetical protein
LTGATVVVVLRGTVTARLTLDPQVVFAHVFVVAAAGVGDGSSVAIVVVDGDKVRRHAAGADILNHDVARAVCPVVRAVTATAVEFPRVGDGVVADGDAALSIVLDDLVVGASGTAAVNENFARSKSGDGVYSS